MRARNSPDRGGGRRPPDRTVAQWLALLWRTVTSIERSRARPTSGVQRTAVMGAAMAICVPWLGWGMGAAAGVAALLVGMLDLRQNPAARLRTMLLGAVLLAATTLVARELSPWPPAVVALLAAVAFGEGAGIAVHREAPVILQLNGIVIATALLEPQPRTNAGEAALVVLIAGAAQALASFSYALRRRVVREVEVAASALADVGAFLRAAAAAPASRDGEAAVAGAAERAASALSSAQHLADASDLAPATLTLVQQVLSAADRLRIEGRALDTGTGLGLAGAEQDQTVRAARLVALAAVLDRCAADLRRRSPVSPPAVMAGRPGDPAWELAAAAGELGAQQRWQRITAAAAPGERRRSIRAALRPAGLPFRFGSRVAVASLAAGAIGAAGNLTHASWSVNACLSVLRPDGGAIVPRFVLRATATALAAAGVVAEVAVVGGNRSALAVAALGFAYLMFSFGPTNYGIYGLTVTWSVLSIVAFTSPHPQSLALARLVDTVVGCLLALAAGFAIPVWNVTQLPRDVAACCAAVARRFTGLAEAAAAAPAERDLGSLRAAGVETRDAITGVLTTFRAASLEPASHVPVGRLRASFDDVRGCARLAVAAEHLLSGGVPAAPDAAALARETAALLDALAAAVGEARPVNVPAAPASPASAELDVVLRTARSLAARALQVGWAGAGSAGRRPGGAIIGSWPHRSSNLT